uniref:uncharacterized protein LOC122583381 n=1 Tax=Erigeron canadensis TaxID=72917 RepID=UPI001CB9264C|nr:uncharacterized protein LOC122583381 [Erigeron canadensis]
MSNNIPFEIQMEIIHRIPDIKWVVQYRSVSKAWKSMIDSKKFVTGRTRRHIQQQPRRLLIRGKDFYDSQQEVKYVSIVDDDTFPLQKFNLSVPDFCRKTRLVGSSHGLFCFYDFKRNMVIWNPSIENFVLTVVDYKVCSRINVFFGVCPNTLDPKILKIPYRVRNATTQVKVFTLSLGAWRSPLSNTCPRESISMGSSQAVVDGFIYWNAYDSIEVDGGFRTSGAPIVEIGKSLPTLVAYEPESKDINRLSECILYYLAFNLTCLVKIS